jgi:hypothetical protein
MWIKQTTSPSRELYVTDKSQIPSAALWLGLAGLIPFVACAVQIALGLPLQAKFVGPAIYALQLYSAVILSFMGGAQWGLAVRDAPGGADTRDRAATLDRTATLETMDWRRYGISVLPALIAWAGLWIGGRNGLLLIAAGLATLLAYDLWTVARGEAPAWYGRLRAILTAVAVTALVIAAAFLPF